jgi:predicted transcriptional regulator
MQLTPEEETRLAELAARTTGDLVQEAVKRYIEDDAKFTAAVIKGLASLDRGEFIRAVFDRIDALGTNHPHPNPPPSRGREYK